MVALPKAPVKPGRGPAHTQIELALETAIERGRLSPGDRLPAERELAERYGVSRMTLRQALGSLELRGRLVRSKGRYGGTFVAEPKLELTGTSALSDQLRNLGVAAGGRLPSPGARPGETGERGLGQLGPQTRRARRPHPRAAAPVPRAHA